MKNTTTTTIALALLAAVCLAQTPPTIQWQKCLGGSDRDYAGSIQQTSDGGFIVAGYSCSNDGDVSGHHGTPGDSTDYWIVKLDSTGEIDWQRSLGGSDWDWAFSIQQTADGGFIVAGRSESNDGDVSGWHEGYDGGDPTSDYWVVKLSPDDGIAEGRGIQLNTLTIGAYPNPFNSSCAITVSYSAGVAGNSVSTEGKQRNEMTLKVYDLNGKCVGAGLAPAQQQGDRKSRPYIWTPDQTIPSGIYLVRAIEQATSVVCTKRIVYLK